MATLPPLSIDVEEEDDDMANLASSSSNFFSKSDNACDYEVVNYAEIQFPDFRRAKRLGRGAYGTVMACWFRGKPAAAKLVETPSVDFKTVRAEAELLHGFKHKNIVKLHALFHGDMTGLVLELMEGGSLSELLHQQKHIKYQTCHVLNWAVQLVDALSYLHAHSFIHRDIKPSNMLLTRDYIGLKLCDFGTVAELQTSMTNNRGTAAWMAPEVFRGRKYDQRCDIFSLGISLWEMISRMQPFAELAEDNPMAVLWKVAESGLRPPRIEDLPEPLMELIERCWADDPRDRPVLEEVQRTLEAFLEIFPNARLLPLVDRSTGRPALVPPALSPLLRHPSEPLPNSAPFMPPATTMLPAPPPFLLGHRRTGSHDIVMGTHRHQLQLPTQYSQQLSSHSCNDMSDLPGAAAGSSSGGGHCHRRYSPNTVPGALGGHCGGGLSLERQHSYSPCMTQPQHPPPAIVVAGNALLGDAEKRKKRSFSHGIIQFFSGLKKELINNN